MSIEHDGKVMPIQYNMNMATCNEVMQKHAKEWITEDISIPTHLINTMVSPLLHLNDNNTMYQCSK